MLGKLEPEMQRTSSEVVITFPLRGTWEAFKSPGHHRYAFDFAALGGDSPSHLHYFSTTTAHLLLGKARASDAYGWSAPVYAPCDGQVIEARDGWPDRTSLNLPRDLLRILLFHPPLSKASLRHFTGNYVILQMGSLYAFLAHLQCQSLRVEVGAQVVCGQVIGAVGNSGNTLFPHLHFQVQDTPDLLTAQILPFRLRSYERWNGSSWEPIQQGSLAKGERLRSLASEP